MFGSTVAYVVSICAMMFAGISALTLIRTVKHFDPPEDSEVQKDFRNKSAA